ncbi:hypothetical protein CC86DRAFT_24804 [Ophiobolus disseminans]|uniref:Uncharacterized protein n=1 Tax=Ophiobolus disseminans TaxID=1469910 RepID=A0A6A6ZZ12_9PLEO|nr:hypothetical protein CC86DRAFT_24804 [Ophiobolus disseminans]
MAHSGKLPGSEYWNFTVACGRSRLYGLGNQVRGPQPEFGCICRAAIQGGLHVLILRIQRQDQCSTSSIPNQGLTPSYLTPLPYCSTTLCGASVSMLVNHCITAYPLYGHTGRLHSTSTCGPTFPKHAAKTVSSRICPIRPCTWVASVVPISDLLPPLHRMGTEMQLDRCGRD